MTYPEALKSTVRSAALFAVVYCVATALMDQWAVGEIAWIQQVVSTILATILYWAVIAWMAKRKHR